MPAIYVMVKRSISPIVKWMPAVLVAAGIAVLSLWENPRMPSSLSMSDKVLHGAMYFVLAVAWLVPLGARLRGRVMPYIYVWLGATGYGALMEVLQRYCTLSRSGEMADLYADTVGALVGVAIAVVSVQYSVFRNQ